MEWSFVKVISNFSVFSIMTSPKLFWIKCLCPQMAVNELRSMFSQLYCQVVIKFYNISDLSDRDMDILQS